MNLLVVVDQFEELFRYRAVSRERAKAAVGRPRMRSPSSTCCSRRAHSATLPIYVVLTMRSDFLGDCAQFQGLPEAINEGQYLVPRLTRDERPRRDRRAGRRGRREITPVLLTRLVNDVGDNPDQLSILQHALNRTWAPGRTSGRRRRRSICAHYEAIGTHDARARPARRGGLSPSWPSRASSASASGCSRR